MDPQATGAATEKPLGLEYIKKHLEGVRNLPTLPMVVDKVTEAVRDPNVDARKVAKIIEDDQAMMARILRVVNSALYSGLEKVTSVQHAIARIGMNAVKNVALSTAMFSSFGAFGSERFNREAFWRHSISVGIAGSVVSMRAGKNLKRRYSKDVLHLAGLLHDIGKVIFEQFFHESFVKALEIAKTENISLLDAENRVMGATHTEVGAILGAKWKMGPEFLQVIRWHHDPMSAEASSVELVGLVHMANYICNLEHLGDSGNPVAAFHSGIWKQLGLTVGDIPAVVDEVKAESTKSELLMSLI